MSGRLLVITPVRNEAANVERTIRAMAAQTRPPDLWVVVDDGSEDDTAAIARSLAEEVPFMRVEPAPALPAGAGRDRLAAAAELRAFNAALGALDWRSYTHVGKLDGDVELPPEWYERLLERFAAEPRLGIAGGDLLEPAGDGWELLAVPDYHVHGAVKLWSTECLEAIGGLEERLGWDTIDMTYARMRGFTTRCFPDLVARHHRAWGSADGRLRGAARYGECAYIVRYGLPWVALRSLKVARTPPVGLTGAAFLYGYVRATARRAPRVEDEEFRRHVRGELRGRVAAGLRGVRGR